MAGFSSNVCLKAVEHSSDLIGKRRALPRIDIRDVREVACEKEVILHFMEGTMGDAEELAEFVFAISMVSFCDICCNRHTGSSHLTGQSVTLISGKATSQTIQFENQGVSFLPHDQILKGLHR